MEKLLHCYKCKSFKVLSEFNKDKSRYSGYCSKCKLCSKWISSRKNSPKFDNISIKEKEKILEELRLKSRYYKYKQRQDKEYVKKELLYHHDWYRANLAKNLLKAAKSRANKNNLDFNIDISDIIIPEHCPLLNIKLEYGTMSAPSLDRIDNTKGYIKGNVMVISRKANTMKSSATLKELKNFCGNANILYNLAALA